MKAMISLIVPKFALVCCILLLSSCSNDSDDDVVENYNTTNTNSDSDTNTDTNSDTNTDTDTVSITYSTHIQSIMTNNCVSCHSNSPVNGAGYSLTSYESVKNSVQSMGLINRITKSVGETGFMPKGGSKLPQTLIDQIIQWKNNDYPQ